MDDSEEISIQDNIFEIVKKNWLVIGLLVCGLFFVVIGIVQMSATKTASVKFEKGVDVAGANTESQDSKGNVGAKIKVDVEGEVQKPGVYSLNSDARVQDALIAAGGLTADAQRDSINLAQRIADGQKLYVPAVGEEAVGLGSKESLVSGGSMGGESAGGLVSINSGSQSELESLPAIGPVTAGKIIGNRPYGSIEELKSKKAVGSATFEKIKDLITL